MREMLRSAESPPNLHGKRFPGTSLPVGNEAAVESIHEVCETRTDMCQSGVEAEEGERAQNDPKREHGLPLINGRPR